MRVPSVGTLRYTIDQSGPKLNVEVDQEIVRYARSLVPDDVQLNPQRYAPHITVIRRQPIPNMETWGLREGQTIEFLYDPCVVTGQVYYWLRAWSPRLLEIRVELGLEPMAWACRPPDNEDCFHITIGNLKGH